MKKLAVLFFILILSCHTFSQESNYSMEKIKKKLEELKKSFAPDKRVAVFNIEASESGENIVLSGETNLPHIKERLFPELEKSNLIDSIKLLPGDDLGENIFGVVNVSVANMRSTPEHSAELSTQALLGTPLKVLKKKGGWYLVQTPDEYLGWMDDDGFTLMNQPQLEEWKSSKKVLYTERYGLAYSSADLKSLPVSDLTEGNILKWISSQNNFLQVEFPDGRKAFIPSAGGKEYAVWISELSPSENNIINKAFTFLGVPYLWGGTSAKGVDCSGFTKTVFYLNGIILPRDASQQVHTGELVDTENGFEKLKPGDLLFFGTKASETNKEKIIHVGIYIGNMEFIHSSGMVKVNSLDKKAPNFSEYRFRTFVKAKRILNNPNAKGIQTLAEHKFYQK